MLCPENRCDGQSQTVDREHAARSACRTRYYGVPAGSARSIIKFKIDFQEKSIHRARASRRNRPQQQLVVTIVTTVVVAV
jgi:hypothetical protein